MENNLEHTKEQEQANSKANREQQSRGTYHSLDLAGQHSKVGLGYGYHHSHNETDNKQYPKPPGLSQTLTHVLSHRGHCHIGSDIKESDAHNKQDCRNAKHAQLFGRDINPGGK